MIARRTAHVRPAPLLRSRLPALGVLVTCAVASANARADQRNFVFTYEATTMPPGQFEYEQWATWKTHKEVDSAFDRLEFRHEIEAGLTDDFQLAIYFADWRYQDGRSVVDDGAEVRDSAIEAIYALSDPNADLLGVALYGELKVGDELLATEGKLILQKNFGELITAYNLVVEAEWEGEHYEEDNGKFEQTFGASLPLSRRLRAGIEMLHEIEREDWAEWADHVVYAGPNLSYGGGDWWITLSPLFQLTDVDGEVDFQTRLIFGVYL
ncbi:MAG: hypothetical protein AB1486_25065 [Planctomycetota bacterium]